MKGYSQYKRRSVFGELTGILTKEGDFVELTEWHNGEGFDICINEKTISVTCEEFRLIKKLHKKLKKYIYGK